MTIKFVVGSKPPYKQSPANSSERENQAKYRAALQKAAQETCKDSGIISTSCSVSIHYIRHKGKSDGANIIGGILDGLQGIVFVNDGQVTEIHYTESEGIKDQYQVSIVELPKI